MDENVYKDEKIKWQDIALNDNKDSNITIRISSKIKDEYISLFGRTMSNRITSILVEQIAEEKAKRALTNK